MEKQLRITNNGWSENHSLIIKEFDDHLRKEMFGGRRWVKMWVWKWMAKAKSIHDQ